MAKKMVRPINGASCQKPGEATRRQFLKGATSAAAGLIPGRVGAGENPNLLPTVILGPHRVTRLIVGSNPLNGFSHFNALYGRHMLEYFTEERAVQFLLDCEKAGINTWQASYRERMARQHQRLREAGGKIQWICLAAPWTVSTAPEWTPDAILTGMLKCVEISAKLKPIGIAHHGSATDPLWRAGKIALIQTFINKVHDLGMLAGISIHNPLILEAVEAKGWSTDFYMASFYDLTREDEDFRREMGVVPVGETYLSSDPPRMCQAVRQARKLCLAYKILAAGRLCNSPPQIRQAFEFAYKNIKPADAVIVGIYPRYSDQIAENTGLVREILA